jgi:hypothetical protein
MIQIEARTIRELRNKIVWLKEGLPNANDCQLSPTHFFRLAAWRILPCSIGGLAAYWTIDWVASFLPVAN